MNTRRFTAIVLAASVIFILTSVVIPQALSQSGDIIYACYNKNNGSLRKVNSAADCTSKEASISWNQVGPQGPPGLLNPNITTNSADTAVGVGALVGSLGYLNSAFGVNALNSNTTGRENTAVGRSALEQNTTGEGNTAMGERALFHNVTGSGNTAIGLGSLMLNVSGRSNTAIGGALTRNTTGSGNTACGAGAMGFNTEGIYNTATGSGALYSNTIGSSNTADGFRALLSNTIGTNNTAIGLGALEANTTGSYTTGVGFFAGGRAIGDNNLYINNDGGLSPSESSTIRIGTVTAGDYYHSAHVQTFIAGIANASVYGSLIQITNDGQLGVATSSRQFKEDIQDMGDASTALLRLRPVTFRYKPEYSQGDQSQQYGLIAEEVARVYPDLVQYDKDGKAFSVKYQVLSSMLLNELQKQNERIASMEARMAALEALVSKLTASNGK